MDSLYKTFDLKTASMQELKDQTKKLQHENDTMDLKRVIRDSIRAETLKEGISLKIENEDGRVFFRPRGTIKCNSALNIELKNKGVRGKIYVEPGASSWFTGGWAKALVLAGTVYLYRNELRIIGRGVLAGANLAIEHWEQRQRQKDGELKGKEVEEEKEQGKEEQMMPVVPSKEEGINQNASIYPPRPPPIQPPQSVYVFSCVRCSNQESPSHPTPHCQQAGEPVHTPTPTPLPPAYIRQILLEREIERRWSTKGEDVIAPPNTPYDSSGFDADMDTPTSPQSLR